jgi:hypothetical protein
MPRRTWSRATIRVPVDPQGYRDLRRFAARWPAAVWAIEGAGGLGAPLATRLSADGIAAVDVPAKLAARVRVLSTGHGRKNDDADATSVAVAAHSAAGLRTVTVDEAVTALRAGLCGPASVVCPPDRLFSGQSSCPGGAPRGRESLGAGLPARRRRFVGTGGRWSVWRRGP